MVKKWIQKAIKRPGAFKAKAQRAGLATRVFAHKVLRKASTATVRTKAQARLAIKLMSFRKNK